MTKRHRITKHVPTFLAVDVGVQQRIAAQCFVGEFEGAANNPDVVGCDFSHRRGGLNDNRRGGNHNLR